MDSPHNTTGRQLVLIPTPLEYSLASTQLETLAASSSVRVELCGLGLVQAAVASTHWIQLERPSCVWLVGIAGTYGDRLPLAQACEFSRVACYGIGVGDGCNFRLPSQLGWLKSMVGEHSEETIEVSHLPLDRLLISVAAASADENEADRKLRAFPKAVAEDMESYAVAVACRSLGVPLRIVRGVSNQVGDRDQSRWQAAAAMQAAVILLGELMKA